ncbi:acyl-CoA dehydrogenase [Streptomyces lydicus]|uniref:acyl-CoA dehydrogenase family protein n=1 Tax=Streptomyces lydicus TaxID=47763 RepID=UPI0037891F63
MPLTDLTAAAPTPTVDALTQALYPEGPAVHRPWAQLIAADAFRHRDGLTDAEAIELAYQRLRRINALVEPLALAADPVRLAAMHEWTAIADGRVAALAGIHYNLHLGSLLDAQPHSGRALDDVLAMRTIGTFLVTEWGHGADAAALESTATRDSRTGEYVLHTPTAAAQKFMPNTTASGGPKGAVVAARLLVDGTDHGVFLFHVPLDLPGVQVQALPAGTAVLDHALTRFHSVRLPAHALLEGEHGTMDDDGTVTSTVPNPRRRLLHTIRRVTPGKLCMAAVGIGLAKAAVATAVRYAHHRHISGASGTTVPLAAHRSHHARLIAGGLANVYALTLMHRTVLHAWAHADDDQRQVLERDVALLKARATWTAQDVVLEMRECCGAHGLLPSAGFPRWTAPVAGAITAEGDNQAILAKSAGELALASRPPLPDRAPMPSLGSDAPLRDLRHLLTVAESIAADEARHRLASSAALGRLARWNHSCLPALEAAEAHTAGMAADAMITAVEECADPQAQSLLEALSRLYMLQELGRRAAALQAHGHVTAAAVRQLPDVLDTLMDSLLPHMTTLVDSFGLDAYLATVPLAGAAYVDVPGEAGSSVRPKDQAPASAPRSRAA